MEGWKPGFCSAFAWVRKCWVQKSFVYTCIMYCYLYIIYYVLFLERRRASCSDEETVTISPHECSVEVRQFLTISLFLSASPHLSYGLLDKRTHTLTHTHHDIVHAHHHHHRLGSNNLLSLCFLCVLSYPSPSSQSSLVVASLSRSIAFPLVLTLYTHTHTYTSCVSTSDEGVYTQIAIATLPTYIII